MLVLLLAGCTGVIVARGGAGMRRRRIFLRSLIEVPDLLALRLKPYILQPRGGKRAKTQHHNKVLGRRIKESSFPQ